MKSLVREDDYPLRPSNSDAAPTAPDQQHLQGAHTSLSRRDIAQRWCNRDAEALTLVKPGATVAPIRLPGGRS